MATLYVSYFAAAEYGLGGIPVGYEAITTSASNVQGTKKGLVAVLFSDTAHKIAVGSNPNAATAPMSYVPANTERWIKLQPNEILAATT